MDNWIYLIVFLISIPVTWFILLASNLEKCFKQGRILEIRIAYILLTLIFSHLLASCISTFVSGFTSLI